jgi:hypothetical protein
MYDLRMMPPAKSVFANHINQDIQVSATHSLKKDTNILHIIMHSYEYQHLVRFRYQCID